MKSSNTTSSPSAGASFGSPGRPGRTGRSGSVDVVRITSRPFSFSSGYGNAV
ncbi:hypothetical protein [Frigoriglobus tundricola]|uniref:hypothetical protein n=1 Tax=Frigoriglobus tundricola TaxID=2774151 RepID=UPI001D085B5F|nr:hypothetical protein [Frigoriglobus tundricola]